MKIAYLFDTKVEMDSRAQKEIAAFARHGHSVTVYEWNKDENYPVRKKTLCVRGEKIPCISIGIKVKKNKGFKSNIFQLVRFEAILLLRLLKQRAFYDIIYSVNLDTAYIGRAVAKSLKIPFIYDVFDDYADAHQCGKILNRIIKKIDYNVMRNAKKVILCSEKRKQQIIGPLQNCEIVYNVPDISIAEESEKKQQGFTIVYVGNLVGHRMIEDLLEIAASHPDWRLECGGEGTLRELVQQYANQYSNITYHGILSYEEVIRLEQTADVIPALYDPSIRNNTFAAPNKVFEAMNLGKPTIMVRNTGMDDLVEGENTGQIINCDRTSLENALKAIYQDITFWREEAPRIRKLAEEKYNWKRMEEKLLSLLHPDERIHKP